MKRRFAISATLGTLASLVGLAVLAPFPSAAQEEQREEGETGEREVTVLRGTPGGVFMAARSGGYLGVRIVDVDEEDVERLGLPEERGTLVVEVVDGTPAAEAGLEPDDVIVRWNDERVESAAEFSRLVRETPPGRTVRLGVVRDGSERDVRAELGEPERAMRSFRMRSAPNLRLRGPEGRVRVEGPERAFVFRMGRPRLGVSVSSLSDQLGEYFGVENGDGALITEVHEETPAARAGLRAGDVIRSVAGEEVDGPGDISRILADRDAGPVEVEIVRDRQARTITVELE
ncbi:MAG: PDZ domain-containing protein, partial [Gemmatimonadota bacterium]|nr:PDZ domain-containing protein [Gemmatimonadota bacterium]